MGDYRIARVGLHHFEEPCISGDSGSGTVFFSGCNLRCVFCQNYEISHNNKGLDISEGELIFLIRHLEDIGAANINLVTPSNYTNKLKDTLKKIKSTLKVPVVWNSSGYETVANLKKLEGLVDVYLPDFKYSDDNLAREYSNAPGYERLATAAISEMRRQQPLDKFENGLIKRGVIVRHLVLPGEEDNTAGVMRDLAAIDKTMYVSVMGQYFSTPNVARHDRLSRRLTQGEYDAAIDSFYAAGLKNGYSQALDSATEEYVPDFDLDVLRQMLLKYHCDNNQ